MIRCKLISPMNLLLEHPMLSPVKETEFVVMGVNEYRNMRWSTFLEGATFGAGIIAVIAAFLISMLAAKSSGAQAVPAGKVEGGALLIEGRTRYLADFSAGTASGLGYKLPDLNFGLTVEKPLGPRWEAQGAFQWSPDAKVITNDGNVAHIGAQGLFWLNHRLAASAQERFVRLWTSQFDKSSWIPSAGVVIRDNWQGAPGRTYLDYVFATGCQWATPSNPCRIQSNRQSGIEFFQEFRFLSHWRFVIKGAWVHFADQANPLQPGPRVWHDTGTVDMGVRYEFRGVPGDVRY